MSEKSKPIAVTAAEVSARTKPSVYPEPFASRIAGREKRLLGDLFGLTNFGVNLTRLSPNAVSALRHAHTKQDEFVYILQGRPTLHTDEGRTQLIPGMCAGFKAGTGNGHRLINETSEEVVYLEVGDRTPGDEGSYPDDDLRRCLSDGKWQFVHGDLARRMVRQVLEISMRATCVGAERAVSTGAGKVAPAVAQQDVTRHTTRRPMTVPGGCWRDSRLDRTVVAR